MHQGIEVKSVDSYLGAEHIRANFKRLETGSNILHPPDFHRGHHKAGRRYLNLTHVPQGDGIAGVGQNCQPAKSRDNVAQEFESFASKIALLHLVARLRCAGFELLDTQFVTKHLARFGAIEIPRQRYQELLQRAISHKADFYCEVPDSALEELMQSSTQIS